MDRDEEERLQQPDLTAFSDEDGDSGDESEHEIPEQTDRQDQRQQQRQPAGPSMSHTMNREAMGRMGLDSRRMKRLDKKQRIRGPSSEIHGMSSFKYEAARRSMFTRRFGGTDEDREMMMEDVMGGNFERQNDRLVHLDLVPVFAADDFIDSEDELDKPQQ